MSNGTCSFLQNIVTTFNFLKPIIHVKLPKSQLIAIASFATCYIKSTILPTIFHEILV